MLRTRWRAATAVRRTYSARAMSTAESKLAALGLALPAASPPRGNYAKCVRTGNYIYTAGQVSMRASGELITGTLGRELTVQDGYAAAQRVALSLLATLQHELGGDLGRIKRVVKLTGFVNSADGFAAQPQVIDGASDLLVAVLGETGRHARTAVGTNALPSNVAVEIEAIVEVYASAPSQSSTL